MLKRVPGTKDILPEEVSRWQKIEEISRNIFAVYNYQEIRSPIIEDSALFNRSLGESTEIIQKQMFLIRNNEDTYALRPEGTASIVRAYIENNLDKTKRFAKFYYIGPMFRLERPQKGRLRQFHHIGCEVIGSQEAHLDVELIALAANLLDSFSLEGYEIKINSLGCAKDKQSLAEVLRKALEGKITQLCADCQARFKQNVLRILDCKNDACREVVHQLCLSDKHLCPECKTHFTQVKDGLDFLGINYHIRPYLVRGLDYYTRTVFEITHKDLGAQDAIGAGGRYDRLVKELGGPDLGAMGFAFGVERLMLVINPATEAVSRGLVYLITLGGPAKKQGLKLLNQIRKAGIPADADYEAKSLKGAMRTANDLNTRYVLILGDDELSKQVVTLKDMVTGEQKEVKIDNITNELKVEPPG